MKYLYIIFILAANTLMAGIEYSLFPPAERIFLSNVQSEDTTFAIEVRNKTPGADQSNRWVGNSIKCTKDYVLDKFTLRIAHVGQGAPGSKMTVSIVDMGWNDITGEPSKVMQTEKGFVVPANIKPDGYLTFDVKNLKLEARRVYGFQLSFEEPGDNRGISFWLTSMKDPDRTYGCFYTYDEGTNYKTGHISTHFYIQEAK